MPIATSIPVSGLSEFFGRDLAALVGLARGAETAASSAPERFARRPGEVASCLGRVGAAGRREGHAA